MPTNSIGPGRENMAVTLKKGEPAVLLWYAAQLDKSRNELMREHIRDLLKQARALAREMGRNLDVIVLTFLAAWAMLALGDDMQRRPSRGGLRRDTIAWVVEGGEG